MRDVAIGVGDDVAFAHSLNRMSGTTSDGKGSSMWFRETLCFRKIDGAWRIVHQHDSVPIAMDGSGRAALDLKP